MHNLNKKISKIQFDKVCRTCLREGNLLRDISNTKIPNMLENCFSLQISEEDELPKHVCVSCFRQITNVYIFKKKIEKCERILKNHLKQTKLRLKKEEDILRRAIKEAEIIENSEKYEDICLNSDLPKEQLVKILEDKNIVNIELNEEINNTSDKIFTHGPPPLIPIQISCQNKINSSTNINTIDSKNTPPLIPLKLALIPTEIEKIASVELKLECSFCGDYFNSVQGLTEHRKAQCEATGLQCNICRKGFNDRKKLIGHLKWHMVAKDYGCKICGKSYPNPSTFKVHMRSHTGERPFKCEICKKGFVRWAGVVSHMKTHNCHKPYKCETCGKSFKIPSNLERHKVLHSGMLPFCCNFCSKTFSQADNLQLHIRSYHTFEKPFLCNQCGKGFVSSTRLNRHMWVHSGHKPYSCKLCPKAYSNSNDLKIHSKIHNGGFTDRDKPHACKICHMRFFHPCRLVKHMKIHEKKRCNQCNKSYINYNLLNTHIENVHNFNRTAISDK